MNELTLRLYPDEILTTPSAPVTKFNRELRQLASSMAGVMKKSNAVGLSAVQIGEAIQLILVFFPDIIDPREGLIKAFCNPHIISHSPETMRVTEGCLSFPDKFITVRRFCDVEVAYQGLDGKPGVVRASKDIVSQCLQHEISHTLGRLFIEDEII